MAPVVTGTYEWALTIPPSEDAQRGNVRHPEWIGGDLDVHQTTLSHHYRVLREAGVTWTTVQGRTRLVRLRGDDLDALFPGLLDSVLNGVGRTRAATGS